MSLVSVDEAAQRLGVSPRRVRRLLSGGLLPGIRIGRAWAIDQRHLERLQDHRSPSGRPWSASSAWALLAAADGEDSRLSPVDRSRARRRLRERGLLGVVDRLAVRAQRREFYGHPSALRRLAAEPQLIRSGVSAAAEHSADIAAPGSLEAYVRSSEAHHIVSQYSLDGNAERPNIVLRVVEDAVWPFDGGTEVAPRAVVAVDLLESADDRSRRAGLALARRP